MNSFSRASDGVALRDSDVPDRNIKKSKDYIRMSSVVLSAHVRARSMKGLQSFGLREAAARLLIDRYGDSKLDHKLAAISLNVMALALAMPRLKVYRMKAPAVQVVMTTDLKSMPQEPPRLLRSGFLVEVEDPHHESLIPGVTAIGGYHIGDTWWLLAQRYPDGLSVFPWKPMWSQGVRPENGIMKDSPLLPNDDPKRIKEWLESGGGAACFSVVLGLLLDAAGTPIEEYVDVQRSNNLSKDRSNREAAEELKALSGRHAVGWAIHTLSIPAGYTPSRPREETDRPETSWDPEAMGLTPVLTPIRGYLQRKHTSEGMKWVYVSPYDGVRYRSSRPVRVVVSKSL